MASLISGIWNHQGAAHSLLSAPSTHTQATTAGSNSADDSATISANDFLTLLVTEMQNQDPTANTDPNEYINQLVQVNSLEQLISINQTLTSDVSTTSTSGIAKDPAAQAASALSGMQSAVTAASPVSTAQPGIAGSMLPQVVEGNLAVHGTNPAAQRIAESLAVPSLGR